MSLQVQNLSYILPTGEILFQNLCFSVPSGGKCAIIGDNGIGKSTLLRTICGQLPSSEGHVYCDVSPYYVPQHFGQFDDLSVAEAIGINHRLTALSKILSGEGSPDDFETLNDDWDIQERLTEAFVRWGIDYVSPFRKMGELSGGEKTRVFLAGMDIVHADLVFMDEPTNHLDSAGRDILYESIRSTKRSLLIVSHDRVLLNMLSGMYEMSASGLTFYPMNYDAYKEVAERDLSAKMSRLHHQQKEIDKAEKSAHKAMERQQKHSARGEKRSAGKCLSRILMGNLKNRAEKSTAALKKVQQERIDSMKTDLRDLKSSINESRLLKIDICDSGIHGGKILVHLEGVTLRYPQRLLWEGCPISLTVKSGERIRIKGNNGCGKSSLLQLIAGKLQPDDGGSVFMDESLSTIYLDQDYSSVSNDLTVYGQMEACDSKKPEHEIKMLLTRFLFPPSAWDKSCAKLSGGEKMRLALCKMLVCGNAPDMIIADEPTNNLDIKSMDILAHTLKSYNGTLIVVSHDERFVRDIGICREVSL